MTATRFQQKIAAWRSRSLTQWASAAGLMALLGFIASQSFDLATFSFNLYDFFNYLFASERLSKVKDFYFYDTDQPFKEYPYPPLLAFLLIPLTKLPFYSSTTVWYIILIVAYTGSLNLLSSIAGKPLRTVLPVLLVLSALLFTPLQSNLRNGQINLMILFLNLLCLRYWQKGRQGSAAFSLAFAIALKVFSIPLLLFFLARKQFKLAAWTVLFTILLLLLPALLLKGEIVSVYQQYFSGIFLEGRFPKSQFSVPGSVYSLLGISQMGLRALIAFLFASILVWVDAKSKTCNHSAMRDTVVYTAYMIFCVAILPVTEKHHFILLFPAVYLLTEVVLQAQTRQKVLFGAWVCFFILFYLPKALPDAPFYAIAVEYLLFTLFGVLFFVPAGGVPANGVPADQDSDASPEPIVE